MMDSVKNALSDLVGLKPAGPKIRYAVVAGGNISQQAFMPGVGATSNSVMTALVTDDPVKYDKLAKMWNLKPYKYAEFDQLLSDGVCDALYIATPNFLHRKFAVPALEKGYHVLLEKPMEVTVEDCEAIMEAKKKSGAKLMIAYRLHNEPGTLHILDRVHKGDIGEPRFFSSSFGQPLSEKNHRAKHGFDAGPVPDMGVYPLNAVRNLFLSEPIEVTAFGGRTPGKDFSEDLQDTVSVTLKFPGDRLAQFTVSYACKAEYYEVVGTKGSIRVKPAFMFGPGNSIGYEAMIGDKKETKTFSETDQFGGETEYFSDCILNNVDPEPNGEEGIMDVRVVCAIKRALETGQPQKLEHTARITPRANLKQVKELKQQPKPSEFIGRDSEPPAQG